MAKLMRKAFLATCVGCKGTNVTLRKLNNLWICSACMTKLVDKGALKLHFGGELVISDDWKVGYISPISEKVEDKI